MADEATDRWSIREDLDSPTLRFHVLKGDDVVGYVWISCTGSGAWHGWHRDVGSIPRGGADVLSAVEEMQRFVRDPCQYHQDRRDAMERQDFDRRTARRQAHEARRRG